jgi:hypothetical protein
MRNALPGLQLFLTDERHAVLFGYHAYGECLGDEKLAISFACGER